MDDGGSLSALWHMRSKPKGKLKQRVQELRVPISSCYEYLQSRPELDLSHNESVRLAVDGLLDAGLEGYQQVLDSEGEVDFLSRSEKNFVQENGRDSVRPDSDDDDDDDDDDDEGSELVSALSGTSIHGGLDSSRQTDAAQEDPGVEVYLQSDHREANTKDVVREFIRKAKKDLVVATDLFSDVELLCDLMEASKLRKVCVHLLLDHLNLCAFTDMWQQLNINSFPNLSVRSVGGQTYRSRTGRRLTGQISETFIICDGEEVLTGSYSFCWLSWKVHRGFIITLKGDSVPRFHQEFLRLSSSSIPVPGFLSVPVCSALSPAASQTPQDLHRSKTRSLWRDTVQHWMDRMENSAEEEARSQQLRYSGPRLNLQEQKSRPLNLSSVSQLGGFPAPPADHQRIMRIMGKAHWFDAQREKRTFSPKPLEKSDSRFPGSDGPALVKLTHQQVQTPQGLTSRMDNTALTRRSVPQLSSVLILRPDHHHSPDASPQSKTCPGPDWRPAGPPRTRAHQQLFYSTYRSQRGRGSARTERSNGHKQT